MVFIVLQKFTLGGIVASSNNVSYCAAENISIETVGTGSIYAGGLVGISVGNVSQSYVNKVDITADEYAEGNKNPITRALGGAVGYAKMASISSCFAYDVTLDDKSSTKVESAEYSLVGGFIGYADESEVSNCATYTTAISAGIVDEFVTNKCSLTECYVSNHKHGNSNLCSELDFDSWTNSGEIKEKLLLRGGYWKFEENKIPYLSF